MRNTRKESRGPAVMVPTKFTRDEAEKLKLAARADTKGNVSEFIRRAVRDRIADILEAA